MKRIAAILLMTAALSSCNLGSVREPNVRGEVILEGLSDSLWVYFSLESGATVGSSRFCDEAEDALWADRTDWDFAICGDYLKTNSGDSGKGLGGIQRNTTDAFQTLETAPDDGYLTDTRKRVE